MPTFDGHKITRAEEAARHAFSRALVKAVREAAKGTGWRCNGGMLFRELNGWFFHAYPGVIIYRRETTASLRVKPMAIDPIFWDLVNMPENQEQSLSFRALGAWVCQAPTVEEAAINEFDMDPAATAAEFVRWTQNAAERALRSLTLEAFADLVDRAQRPGPFNPFHATKLVTQILMGRSDEALQLSSEAVQSGNVGGGLTSEGSFSEMALKWLDAQRAARALN